MTINLSDNNPRISYTVASGVTQGAFVVPFEFFEDEDLNVYVDGVVKTLTTHYTTSNDSGNTQAHTQGTTGYIHFTAGNEVTGISGNSTVVITRDVELERVTDFPTSGPFDVSSLNTELDKFIAIAADLDDAIGRSIQITDFDTSAGLSLTLPSAANRVGKFLSFDGNGSPIVTTNAGNYKGAWSAGVSYTNGDTVTDTTNNNIYIINTVHTSAGALPLTTNTNSSYYTLFINVSTIQTVLIEDSATKLAIALG